MNEILLKSGQSIEIPEKGFEFLKSKIEKLNLKSLAKKIPPIELNTISERDLAVQKLDMWGKKELVCFKKFFTVTLNFEQSLLEELTRYVDASRGEEWHEEFDTNHISAETMLKYIALTYTVRGQYIPKNKADSKNLPTTDEATLALFDTTNKTEIHQKAKFSSSIRTESGILTAKVNHWMKKTDFLEFGKTAPEWTNYFFNLNQVARAKTIDIKNVNYMGGILQTFLRIEQEKKKVKYNKEGYSGEIGMRISFNGTVIYVKEFRRKIGYLYFFHDMSGNIIKWVSDKNMGFEKGETYALSGEVKSHEVDKWADLPTTTIIHAKKESI
jgi:hypothetical protein